MAASDATDSVPLGQRRRADAGSMNAARNAGGSDISGLWCSTVDNHSKIISACG
jgi:hypothetical protein